MRRSARMSGCYKQCAPCAVQGPARARRYSDLSHSLLCLALTLSLSLFLLLSLSLSFALSSPLSPSLSYTPTARTR